MQLSKKNKSESRAGEIAREQKPDVNLGDPNCALCCLTLASNADLLFFLQNISAEHIFRRDIQMKA